MIRRNLYKKITIIIFTTFLFNIYNISCLKNNSSTSDIAITIDNQIYYYRLCGYIKINTYVCKFSCTTDNVSSLTPQNIPFTCENPVGCKNVNEVKNTYKDSDKKEEIYNQIINPILEGNKLNIIPVANDILENFDKSFDKSFSNDDFCKKICKSTCSVGSVLVPWKIIKESSNFIYQKNNRNEEEASLQWSGLMKNSTKMSYDEAITACDNYNFKYSDWTLPSTAQLEKAPGLLEAILREKINENIDDLEDAIWTTDQQNKKEEKYYTICVRKY